jgi:hypothetical protein
MKSTLIRAVVTVGLLAPVMMEGTGVGGATMPGQDTHVTAAEAAPFVGEWTLALQGPNGPGTFTLTVATEKGKVTAQIASDQMATQAITSTSLANKDLVLRYAFTWEGTPVDAVVTLRPAKEDKTGAQIDFAGGAYTMTGTATRKDKVK